METRPPTVTRILIAAGLRALVLRPGAVPVDRLRRPDPAEARGLPLRGPVRRGDPARPGVGRADLRRLGRQGEGDRARRRGRRGGDDRAAAALRADPRPTPARSCARRRCSARPTSSSRPGSNEAEPLPEGGDLPRAQVSDVGAARRDLPHLRRPHPGRVQPVDAGRGRRPARPRRGPRDRDLGSLDSFAAEADDALRILDSQEQAVTGLVSQRRRGLRGALRAPGPALAG